MNTGEAGDGRSDAPTDMATEMARSMTHIPVATARATIYEPMETNENAMWRRRSKAPATTLFPSNWRICMERTIRPQAEELIQLN